MHDFPVPGIGMTPTETPDKDHLGRQLTAARKSDASIGKFSKNLPKEKLSKNMGKKRKVGKSWIDSASWILGLLLYSIIVEAILSVKYSVSSFTVVPYRNGAQKVIWTKQALLLNKYLGTDPHT